MKKTLNNNVLISKNINTKSQRLLVQRLSEMLDNKTIDTYKNRLNNIHGSLREVVTVCKKVQSGIILESHIESVKTECQIKLGKETVLKNNNKQLYDIVNGRIKAKKGTLLNFINELEVIQKELENNYLNWILKDLKENLDKEDLDEINKLSENLITELILRGWSKYSLHRIVERIFIENKNDFEDKWLQFLNEINEEMKEFHFFIKLESEENSYRGSNLIDKNEIISRFPNIPDSILEESSKYLYFNGMSFENDLNKAVNDILKEINAIEAEHIFCGNLIKLKKNDVIVLLPNGRATRYNTEKYNIRTSYESQNLDKFNYLEFDNLRSKKEVHIDTRTRLNNVLMQYRLGYNTDNVETWFTSFWFALESLVVTEQYENIIEHIVEIVTPITTMKYIDKILINAVEDINRCEIDLKEYGIVEENDISDNITSLLEILKNDDKYKVIKASINNYDLLELRLIQLRSIFKNSKTLKNYLESHYKNIEYHLRRLYRIRNNLVHSASVEYDLYPLTMHLHSYLRDIIEEVVMGLNCNCYNSVNGVYSCCKIKYESLIGKLNNNGQNLYENELIISSNCIK